MSPKSFIWKIATPTILVMLFLVVSATPAWAFDMEYYTYGGFGPVTDAFRKIALIFSDDGYKGLFFTIAAMAIFFSGAAWTVKMASGMRMAPLTWGVPVLLGIAIYLGLFVPKGTIHVYDPVMNRFDTIGNIPVGVVATAGVVNSVERGLVNIIDTAGAPGAKYQDQAGGIGFELLRAATRATPKDAHMKASLARYMDDCVTFELTRPGTDLSLDVLRNNTSNFIPELAKAINPAIYTVYYDASAPEGTPMTCTDAWDTIEPIISNPSYYSDAVDAMCGQANFNPSTPAERQACRELAMNTLGATTGASVNPEDLLRQTYLANMLYHFYYTADHELAMQVQANRQIATSGAGMGVTMNSWMPIMRAVMTAVAIGMIPFLALFLPSPLYGKAISVMAGFFIFLTTWGIADAIIHGAAMDHAVDNFEDIRQSELGVYAAMAFPESSTKIQSMFGIVRSSSIMLASFMTMMLIRFGGHALAMMAGSMSGTIQGAGGQAGRQLTPEGKAAAMNEQQQASSMHKAWAKMDEDFLNGTARAGSFNSFSDAAAWQKRGGVERMGVDQAAIAQGREMGLIPGGMSDEAAMKHLDAQRNIGGADGSAQLTMDGAGGASLMNQVRRHGGWESASRADGSGAGWTSHESAAGKYTRDSNGEIGMAKTAAGINMDVSASSETRSLEKAGYSLAHNEAVERQLRADKTDSTTAAQAERFDQAVTNSEQEKLAFKVSEDSGLSQIRSEETGQSLAGHLRAGVGGSFIVKADAGGEAQIQWAGREGERQTWNVSEEQARAFEENRQAARTEAVSETLQDSQQLSYAQGLAERAGATEASSYMSEAQSIQAIRAAGGVNAETAFIRDWADHNLAEQGGAANDKNMQIAMERFNSMATNPNEHDRLQAEMQSWYRGEWGNAAGLAGGDQATHDRIDQTQANVAREHSGMAAEVSPAMSSAMKTTDNISSDSLNAPQGMGTLNRPTSSTVHDTRDRIRDHNEREMVGDGNIQTTIPGMLSEIGSHRQSVPGLPGTPPSATDPSRQPDINDSTNKLHTSNKATGERTELFTDHDGATGSTQQSMDMNRLSQGETRANPFEGITGSERITGIADRFAGGADTPTNTPTPDTGLGGFSTLSAGPSDETQAQWSQPAPWNGVGNTQPQQTTVVKKEASAADSFRPSDTGRPDEGQNTSRDKGRPMPKDSY